MSDAGRELYEGEAVSPDAIPLEDCEHCIAELAASPGTMICAHTGPNGYYCTRTEGHAGERDSAPGVVVHVACDADPRGPLGAAHRLDVWSHPADPLAVAP